MQLSTNYCVVGKSQIFKEISASVSIHGRNLSTGFFFYFLRRLGEINHVNSVKSCCIDLSAYAKLHTPPISFSNQYAPGFYERVCHDWKRC
jgi:hypothetical protein